MSNFWWLGLYAGMGICFWLVFVGVVFFFGVGDLDEGDILPTAAVLMCLCVFWPLGVPVVITGVALSTAAKRHKEGQ